MPAYSSQYYDPNKAHDYYMKNRELKGYENRYGGSRGSYNTAHKSANQNDSYTNEANEHNTQLKKDLAYSNAAHKSSVVELKTDFDEYMKDESDRISEMKESISALKNFIQNMTEEERRFKGSEPFRDRIFELQQEIRDIRSTRDARRKALQDSIADIKQAQADEQQRIRQRTKGGSTSGFNQKGKEAAEYIKIQMETERDEVVSKINKETDDKMLSRVSRLKDQINKARSKGQNYSSKQFLAKVNSLLSETKKTKISNTNKHKEAYKTKYKKEIDKLRSDDSMFSYWDKRADKVAERSRKDKLWQQKHDKKTTEYNARRQEREEHYQAQKSRRREINDRWIERQNKKIEREFNRRH